MKRREKMRGVRRFVNKVGTALRAVPFFWMNAALSGAFSQRQTIRDRSESRPCLGYKAAARRGAVLAFKAHENGCDEYAPRTRGSQKSSSLEESPWISPKRTFSRLIMRSVRALRIFRRK